MGYTYDFIDSIAIIVYEFVVIASLLMLVSGGERTRALIIGGAWARPQVALVLGYVVALGSY